MTQLNKEDYQKLKTRSENMRKVLDFYKYNYEFKEPLMITGLLVYNDESIFEDTYPASVVGYIVRNVSGKTIDKVRYPEWNLVNGTYKETIKETSLKPLEEINLPTRYVILLIKQLYKLNVGKDFTVVNGYFTQMDNYIEGNDSQSEIYSHYIFKSTSSRLFDDISCIKRISYNVIDTNEETYKEFVIEPEFISLFGDLMNLQLRPKEETEKPVNIKVPNSAKFIGIYCNIKEED